MRFLLAAILFQNLVMPPRGALENPSAVSDVPRNLKKDYDKAWTRFLTGKEDAKLLKDLDKLIRKKKDLEAAIVLRAYLDLYARRTDTAQSRFEQAIAAGSDNRIALYYLAEIAYAENDFARAADLYKRMVELLPQRADLQAKREKTVLLATEGLIRDAWNAEQAGRLEQAESLFRQALTIAPNLASLHFQLGELLTRREKWEEALPHYYRLRELEGESEDLDRRLAEILLRLGRGDAAREVLDRLAAVGAHNLFLERQLRELENLGRWRGELHRFREIEGSPQVSREQVSALLIRYFPEIADAQQVPQIVTDIETSWARPEIQIVLGAALLDPFPNHTFRPAIPVTRGDLASVLSRLSRLLAVAPVAGSGVTPGDVPADHPLFSEIQFVLAAGLLSVDPAANFRVGASVSGLECLEAIEKIHRLSAKPRMDEGN